MCSWIRKCNIIKAGILPKAMQAFNAIAVEVAIVLFKNNKQQQQQNHQKYLQNSQRTLRDSAFPKVLEVSDLKFPEFKNTWQSYSNQSNVITGVKTDMQTKSTEEGSEIDPHVCVKWSSAMELASCVEKGLTLTQDNGKTVHSYAQEWRWTLIYYI